MEIDAVPSVVLYITVFACASILAYFGSKRKLRFLTILAILLPLLLAGFRYNAGTDSANYREYYRQVGAESAAKTFKRITDVELEPIIVGLARLGNELHLNVSFLYCTFAFITLVALFYTAKNIGGRKFYLYYGLLLFMVFPESLNIMRQMAAISVQALALSYIIKCYRDSIDIKKHKVVLLIIFATLLHYSSIALLPVFFIPAISRKIQTRSLTAVMSLIAIGCLLLIPLLIEIIAATKLLPPKYLDAFLNTGWSPINMKFVFTFLLTIVFLVRYSRVKNPTDKTFGFLMLLGTIYSALGFYSSYFGRFSNFFWIFIVIAIAELINRMCEKDATRLLLVIALGVAYFIFDFVIVGANELVPYSFAI